MTQQTNFSSKLRPALPKFERANVLSFVERTVLAEYGQCRNLNSDQISSYQAVRGLIAACICYITDFQPPDKQSWTYVHEMLRAGLDDTTFALADESGLKAVFTDVPKNAYCRQLFESSLAGDKNHGSVVLGKSLRAIVNYIYR